MKKLIYIFLITVIISGANASAELVKEEDFFGSDSLECIEEEFQGRGTVSPEKLDNVYDIKARSNMFADYASVSGGSVGPRKLKSLPVFKKYRIKVENYFKKKNHELDLKEAQVYREELEKEQKLQEEQLKNELNPFDYGLDDEEVRSLTDRSLKKVYTDGSGNEIKTESPISKVKNFFKRNKANSSDKSSSETKTGSGYVSEETDSPALAGGVREVVTQKDMILDCDKLKYDDETSEIEATGNPVMKFPPQKVTIKADRLTYNTEGNIIKAYGNVEITKDGSTVCGDYVMINLNDESSIVTNLRAEKMNMLITAKDVIADEDTIELHDGSLVGEQHHILRLRSNMVGRRMANFQIPESDRSSISDGGLDINVKAQEIYVVAKKKHDIVNVKNADIYFKGNHLTRWGNYTIHTNKGHEYFESNHPEFGTVPRVGMFFGPGYVFDTPNGASLKFIPFINYKDKWGVGAALKYRSGTNYTEMFYGSAKDIFTLRGRQDLDDRLFLQYGINSYLPDWFLGSGMSKYRLEAVYQDSTLIPNTLGEGRHARYRQRISGGYVQDANYNRKGEKLGNSTTGTGRLKYMAELSQNLFNYSNPSKNINLNLAWKFQGSAALYGTGDTQFIARTGPGLHTQIRRWVQDIGYFVTGKEDHTPVPKLDIYRYGRSNVYLRESLRLHKYFTVTWMASSALSNDAPNHKKFQENGFYFSLGPDDLKFTLGYDFVRERSYLLFTTALDLKGTRVDFKKMVIKNPENLAKDDSEKVVPISFDSSSNSNKIVRTHAQIIEIEDPDREQL